MEYTLKDCPRLQNDIIHDVDRMLGEIKLNEKVKDTGTLVDVGPLPGIILGSDYRYYSVMDCTIGAFPCPYYQPQIDRIYRHGAWMFMLWFVLSFVMTATNRWFVYLSDNNNYIHAVIGWIIIFGSMWDIADIVIYDGVIHVAGNHRIPAYIIMFPGLFGFMVTGVAAFVMRKVITWDTRKVIKIRRAHKYIAISVWIISLPVFYLGMENY